MKTQIKIAVVGLGIGKTHLEYYKKIKDVRVVGAVDIAPEVRKDVEEKYKIPCFSSTEELLKTTDIDGVSICTPPDTHLTLTKTFAERGVHILCEKPMAPTIDDCEKMISLCKENNVFLMIGFKKRFSPTYRFVKELFEKTSSLPKWVFAKFGLGRVEREWFWDETSGGCPITENTVHIVDLLHFFLGDVALVYAEGGNFFMPEFSPQIDTAVCVLRFKNGAVASIGAGYVSEWGFAKEEITFTGEKLVCEVRGSFDFPEKLEYVKREDSSIIHKKKFKDVDGFKDEIKHFVECIKNKQKPSVSGEDGLYALKICQAIKNSIMTGKVIHF